MLCAVCFGVVLSSILVCVIYVYAGREFTIKFCPKPDKPADPAHATASGAQLLRRWNSGGSQSGSDAGSVNSEGQHYGGSIKSTTLQTDDAEVRIRGMLVLLTLQLFLL